MNEKESPLSSEPRFREPDQYAAFPTETFFLPLPLLFCNWLSQQQIKIE
jgi:hypothetical protein